MKKVLGVLILLVMIGGLVAGFLQYWPYVLPEKDPFADVPYPIIGSFRYADFAGQDASTADLTATTIADYGTFTFDTSTIWPAAEKMPAGFSPEELLEEGRYLGLGLRGLHGSGVDGRGVAVAVIDTPLPENHAALPGVTYVKDLLNTETPQPTFHGLSMASMMAGVDGVAPKAKIYYYAVPEADNLYASSVLALDKIIELNATLPEEDRVRVVVAAQTVDPLDQVTQVAGAQEWASAITRAEDAGIVVVYPGMSYPEIAGAGVIPGADRDDPANYRQWSWTTAKFWVLGKLKEAGVASWDNMWAELVRLLTEEPELDSLQAQALNTYIYLVETYKEITTFENWLATAESDLSKSLAVPIDCLTIATANGSDTYAYFGSGGLSWGSAYIGGLMALGLQVNPAATTAGLLAALTESATPFETGGKLVNPVGFVEALR